MTKEASEAYQAAKWQALGDYEADKGLAKVSKKSILSLLAVVLISLSLFAACTCGTTAPTTTTPMPEALEWDPDHVMAYYVESTHDVIGIHGCSNRSDKVLASISDAHTF